ncbi:hypothetical protein KP509_20G056200 [Ceratopteris richardii]|uniref:EF-hand domain-containing protein n=1 Tax=Ceratopteris richardii TaxID=49495 RepID=A0A8T2SFH3_CERRI|nr:hypothetical protein KP509_20G056200 [Ceratopteris richardii]
MRSPLPTLTVTSHMCCLLNIRITSVTLCSTRNVMKKYYFLCYDNCSDGIIEANEITLLLIRRRRFVKDDKKLS